MLGYRVIAFVGSWAAAESIGAQDVAPLLRRVQPMVVGVHAYWSTQTLAAQDAAFDRGIQQQGRPTDTVQVGGGVVVGIRNDTLFVLTAAHVLQYQKNGAVADRVAIQLSTATQDLRTAIVDRQHVIQKDHVDLALLRVTNLPSSELRQFRAQLAFWRLTRSPVPIGADVHAFGCPEQQCWQWTLNPGRLDSTRRLVRYLDLNNGFSGGGAFTSDGELIGISLENLGESFMIEPIQLALDSARAWGADVRLAPARIPLRGYHAAALMAVARGGDLSGPASNAAGVLGTTAATTSRAELQFAAGGRPFMLLGYQYLNAKDARVRGAFIGAGTRLLRFGDFERHGGLYTLDVSATVDVTPLAQAEALRDAGGFSANTRGTYSPSLVGWQLDTWGLSGTLRAETAVLPHLILGGLVGVAGYGARGEFNGMQRRTYGGYVKLGAR